jgi:hypothetical protein
MIRESIIRVIDAQFAVPTRDKNCYASESCGSYSALLWILTIP